MQLDFAFTSSRLRTLRSGAVIVPDAPAILRIEGPGALSCLQGLLTGDLAGPGDGSLVYGALLTPKGMIVADVWALRESTGFLLVFANSARQAVLALLARSLPPRLAGVKDLSDAWRAAWVLGAPAADRLARALGGVVPGAGKVLRSADGEVLLAGGPDQAPFRALALGRAPAIDHMVEAALRAGIQPGEEKDLAASRVLGGWPTIGREIDEKTLPQEVRFDEHGGVSYTKGCYTGQETVARIHFRGHVNRHLRGLVLKGGAPPTDRVLVQGDREVGTLRTALLLEDRVVGLAMVRREVESGAVVRVGECDAEVRELPFRPETAGLPE